MRNKWLLIDIQTIVSIEEDAKTQHKQIEEKYLYFKEYI